MGAVDALKAAGVPAANVVDAPQAKTDTESAFNAANIAFTKNAKFKRWVAFGLNDEAALGAVRAAEGRGIKQDAMATKPPLPSTSGRPPARRLPPSRSPPAR